MTSEAVLLLGAAQAFRNPKTTWVRRSQEMTRRFDQGSSRQVHDIITGHKPGYTGTSRKQNAGRPHERSHIMIPAVKVRRPRSVSRKTAVTFFSTSGHVVTAALEGQRTVAAHLYTAMHLPKVFQVLGDRQPKSDKSMGSCSIMTTAHPTL